ncbi:FG-GAP-like repeat-containing protein [Roseiconus lacunae]|uniref:FG-GAP-like repeat-containing protein n=1 Tax=Roseiconus lacunae TaxID=2605694 RepID=UPI0011F31961|nr:FG-GAP-like repeat-containing protein [Roseiconus lacunae]
MRVRPFRRLKAEVLERRCLLASDVMESEPNDQISDADVFTETGILRGSFSSEQDSDYFRVELLQGSSIAIDPRYADSDRGDREHFTAFDLLDSSGRLVLRSDDVFATTYVVPETSDYFLRINADDRFDLPTISYAISVSIAPLAGVLEAEPNDSIEQGNEVNSATRIAGELTSAVDRDVFSIAASGGETIVLDFTYHHQYPRVSLLDSSGSVQRVDESGLGFAFQTQRSDQYHVVLESTGIQTGTLAYTANLAKFGNATVEPERGHHLSDHSSTWSVTRQSSERVSILESVDDKDIYLLEGNGLERFYFDLRSDPNDFLSHTGRRISLLNQYGQLIAYSENQRFNYVELPMLSTPGKYFLVVEPTSHLGLGAYKLAGSTIDVFGHQRDVPLYFFDFDQQLPEHRGRGFDAPFSSPENIPFIIGAFESTYDRFDVDVTTELPAGDRPYISQGVGNFSGRGNGGNGSIRLRTVEGSSIADIPSGIPVGTINHEVGHAVTLNHFRSSLQQVAWENYGKDLFPGTGFGFSTQPVATGTTMNHLDQVDWVLQSGSQYRDPIGSTEPVELDVLIDEMMFELRTETQTTVGRDPHHIVQGDFNGDGHTDLVTANSGDSTMTILYGSSTGVLGNAHHLNVGPDAWFVDSIASSDFNGDGIDDLAHSNYEAAGSISIFLGSTTGPPILIDDFPVGNRPNSIRAANLNADQFLDLVVANYFGADVSVLMGMGDGTFANAVHVSTGGARANSIEIADLNLDGHADVIVGDSIGSHVTVLIGSANGTLTVAEQYDLPDDVADLVALDANLDGKLDVASVSREEGSMTILLGDGGGELSIDRSFIGSPGAAMIETGDVNGDGAADLMVPVRDRSIFEVYLNDGSGDFGRPIQFDLDSSLGSGVLLTDDSETGDVELWIAEAGPDTIRKMLPVANDPRNDRAVIHGSIDTGSEVEIYSLSVVAGDTYLFDIDSAEYQYTLDAAIVITDAVGNVVVANRASVDPDSGLTSADPAILHTFRTSGEYQVHVFGENGTQGKFRLKVTPERAFDTAGPRLLRAFPQENDVIDQTKQLAFWFNEGVAAESINQQTLRVVGQSSGLMQGTTAFDPIKNVLIWTADELLPLDTYTVTLDGLYDSLGNNLDGEINAVVFPSVSGDAIPGGALQYSFHVNAPDTSPATVDSWSLTESSYSSHVIFLEFSEPLDAVEAQRQRPILVHEGVDGTFGTADDFEVPVDGFYRRDPELGLQGDYYLESRGYLEPGRYQLDLEFIDEAGYPVVVSETFSVQQVSLNHGVSVIDLNYQPGAVHSRDGGKDIDVRFSRPVDPATLTTDSFRVYHSSDAQFFDANDQLLSDADGLIDWDVTTLTATFTTATPLEDGFYLVELDGDEGGITGLDGNALDGEFLDSNVNGSTDWSIYPDEFSGDGRAGGDYRAFFGITDDVPQSLTLSIDETSISESGGMAELEVLRSGSGGELTVYLASSDESRIRLPESVTIEAGTNRSATVLVEAIDNNRVDGLQLVTISAVAESYSSGQGFVNYEGNSFLEITDSEQLELEIAENSISEFAGSTTLTVTRPGSRGDLVVTLSSSDSQQLSLPQTIIIPDGDRTSPVINIAAIDDVLVDGNVSVAITASSDGYLSDSDLIDILDHEPLTIEAADSSISENDGQTTIVVTRPGTIGELAVTIDADRTRMNLPTQILILDGETSSDPIVVTAIDDDLVEGDVSVTLVAGATGLIDANIILEVTDYEELIGSLNTAVFSENGGEAELIITRHDTRSKLVLSIESSDPSEASVVRTVTIPTGIANSEPIHIEAVDDQIVDSNQFVQIRIVAEGYQPLDVDVLVTDYEQLELAIEHAEISEFGGMTNVAITRFDADESLIVQISVDAPSEVDIPSLVQFSEGDRTSTIEVFGVDDLENNGIQTVRITVTAPGYETSEIVLNVTDVPIYALDENEIEPEDDWTFSHALVRADKLVWQYEQTGTPFHVTADASYQNPINASDVDASGLVSPIDALIVINEIAAEHFCDHSRGSDGRIRENGEVNLNFFRFFDVNGDHRITPIDALQVINQIARDAIEAEGSEQIVDWWQPLNWKPDRDDEERLQVDVQVLHRGEIGRPTEFEQQSSQFPHNRSPLSPNRESAGQESIDAAFSELELFSDNVAVSSESGNGPLRR